jgi:hypothetical protein
MAKAILGALIVGLKMLVWRAAPRTLEQTPPNYLLYARCDLSELLSRCFGVGYYLWKYASFDSVKEWTCNARKFDSLKKSVGLLSTTDNERVSNQSSIVTGWLNGGWSE